jgi:hypothetical protein
MSAHPRSHPEVAVLISLSRGLSRAALLSTLCATAAMAQHPSPGAQHQGAPAGDAAMAGTWAGTFQMQSTGGMELLVTRDSVWHAKMQLVVDHPFPPVDTREFKVDGKNVSWINDLMGTPCKATATVDAGVMKGEMKCDARTLTFSLTKKA